MLRGAVSSAQIIDASTCKSIRHHEGLVEIYEGGHSADMNFVSAELRDAMRGMPCSR